MGQTPRWAPSDANYQALRRAVEAGHLDKVTDALTSDTDINALHGDGFEGQTLLHEAAARGHAEILRYLLGRGPDVDALDCDQFGRSTPLFWAARVAQAESVKVLLDAGAGVETSGPNDDSVLSVVLRGTREVTQRHFDTISVLLERSIDVNYRVSPNGLTVVEQAVKTGHIPMVQFLIKQGANLSNTLTIAAEFGKDPPVTTFLLSAGATDVQNEALSRAASKNKIAIAETLCSHPSFSPTSGSSRPLTNAASAGDLAMLTLLLSHGLPVNGTDATGRSPLHAAAGARCPNPEVVKLLLSHGADPTARTVQPPKGSPYITDDTPLHAAAWRSNPETVRLLLDASRSTLSMRNAKGETPLLTFARHLLQVSHPRENRDESEMPRIAVLRLLLDVGADVNAVTLEGETALGIVAANEATDDRGMRSLAGRLLVEKGADVGVTKESASSNIREFLDSLV